jgi:hypothetical protein
LVEAKHSPEVQTFMAAFHRLRDRISDDPSVLEREVMTADRSLAKLCRELDGASWPLKIAQRSRRQLYSAPTNPNFVAAWREYEANYARPLARISLFGLGLPKMPEESAADENDASERIWEWEQDEAESNAEGFRAVVELAEEEIDVQAKHRGWDEDDVERAREGLHAWRGLVEGAEFDLAGVFRRRRLTPFVMIPRHVSGHYDASDPLSLTARLQQAQEAFVYGVQLGALAIMRSILEIILRKHYQLGEGKLSRLIETAAANGLFPSEIHLSQIQTLHRLGNDSVHPNPQELHKVFDIETEVLSLLFILRTLIERTPNNASC